MIVIHGFIRARLIICFLLLGQVALAQWPKVIPLQNGGKITIYQPQPESLIGDKITGRAAVSIQKTASDAPVFGAVFYVSTISTDKVSRTVGLEKVNISYAKFPGINDSTVAMKLEKLLQIEVPKWNMETSMEELVASLNVKNVSDGANEFKNDPPKIIYRNKPTTLVIVEGDPKIQLDKGLDANRVVNTPSLIFQDENKWKMYSGGVWYRSDSIINGWKPDSVLSIKVKTINDTIKKQEKARNDGKEITAKPEVTDILVSTVAAELLQTRGAPVFKTIAGTSLSYVSNSVNDIFKEIDVQKFYVLLSGRWYIAGTINGPWAYTAAEKIHGDFAKIPEASEKGNVLASVPGTIAAEEAKIDAQIPQTAKVDRKTATVKVEYDGTPLFKRIEGTSLELAENTNIPVMKDSAGKYFALDNGVWFVSDSPEGPWAVSEARPKDVENIPASSSAFNTKYVYVFESTPEYVYTGYTSGYTGSYVSGSTIVYGTGYYYNPWYGSTYYAHPVTWGMGFSYNPWYGWGMSVGASYNFGFISVGISFGGMYGYGGWYGPPVYYPPYRPPYYGGGGNYGNGPRVDHHNNAGGGPQVGHHNNNIYNNKAGVATRDVNRGRGPGASTRPVSGNTNRPAAKPATGVNNNIYADRNGNTFQRNNNGGWNQRDNQAKQWNSVNNNDNRTRDLNRDYQNRNRATTRQNNFQSSNRAVNRGGGGMRGGGGGRRR